MSIRSLLGISAPIEARGITWPFDSTFSGMNVYPLMGLNQTIGNKIEDIDTGYTSLVYRAYMQNPVVFACMRVRRDLFTEARFQFQALRAGEPGDLFGTPDLRIIEKPWPGATTGDLLKYMITDNDMAGNAFVARRAGRLVRMRPDWTRIIHVSPNPDGNMWDLDARLFGYAYQPGGPGLGRPWELLLPEEVAHFSTTPDPLLPVRGMSWLTPLLREIMADEAMTAHRLKYFEHGGTPNLVLKTQYTDVAKLREFMNFVRQEHSGVLNAYKMMGFTTGVDATVVGSDLQQLDFKVVQGAGETRIAAAAGVPPVVVGLSEGLQGSSLNAGNFQASMRSFADLTMSPAWRNAAGSLEQIVPPPGGARLWYDIRGIPALKDDVKDAAEVQLSQAQTLRQYLDGGFEADAAIDAITSGDMTRLKGKHSGLFSVQLQAPGSTKMPAGEVPGEQPVGGGKGPETAPMMPMKSPTNGKTPMPVGGKP
jgi:phage portal protein BeeE